MTFSKRVQTSIVSLGFCALSAPSFAQPITFVEACLGDTKILNTRFECTVKTGDELSIMDIILNSGEKMQIKTTGKFGKRSTNLKVFQIQHLPPRNTELGMMPESVQFQARSGSTMATVTILCHQSDVALIGVDEVSGSNTPMEQVGYCNIK